MGVKIAPPGRNTQVVDRRGFAVQRAAVFFEELTREFENLPGVAAVVADSTVISVDPNIIALRNKINELLAALRTAGLMEV